MKASRQWNLPKRSVHVVDREADSLYHLRQWHAEGHLFLVRADDRRVTYRKTSRLLSEVVQTLSQEGAFQDTGAVEVRGKNMQTPTRSEKVTLRPCEEILIAVVSAIDVL